MKKAITFMISFCLMFCCVFTAQPVQAATYTYNSFEYTVSGKNAVITKYNGTAKSVTVPEKIGSYTVNNIGAYAFFDNKYMQTLTLPSSVTAISNCAFASCAALTKVNFASGLKTISTGAFSDCKKLENVTLPSSVTKINASAFENCDSFTSFTFPESVSVISNYVLNSCNNITSITLGKGATAIEQYAFENLAALTKFSVASGNVNFTTSSGVLFSKDKSILYRFAQNSSLTTYNVPSGVYEIKPRAFYSAKNLTNITLPSTVNTIGKYAFYNTGYYRNSKNWTDNLLYISNCLIESNCTKTSLSVAEGTKVIADFAFKNSKNLSSVTLPKSVTCIGFGVFSGCDGLKSINVDSSNKYYISKSGILYNKAVTRLIAFPQNSSLTALSVPASVTQIAEYAFMGAKNLKSVSINSVKFIGDYAFYNTPLTSVYIKSTSVGNFAFAYSNVNNVRLSSAIKYVGAKAFYNCTKLVSVNIEGSALSSLGVKSIGYYYSDDGDKKKNVVIYSNSTVAQTYAKQNSLTFKTSDTPVISSVSYSAKGTTIKWDKISGAAGYRVYRRLSSESAWTKIKDYTTAVSFTDSTALKSKVYYYTVRAYYTYNGVNVWSGYDKVGAYAILMPAPEPKIGSVTTSNVTIKWDKVSGATGYRVYRRLAGESAWTKIKDSTTSLSFTDTTAIKGKTYYYTVRAYRKVSGTHWSLYDNTGVSIKLK